MKVWFRVEFVVYGAPLDEFEYSIGRGTVSLIHHEYPVIKETKKGVWIDVGLGYSVPPLKRFVLFNSKRQFASPTLAQAKEKFIRRKQRQISILKSQIDDIHRAIAAAEFFNPKERNVVDP